MIRAANRAARQRHNMKKVYIDSTYHYQLQKDSAGKGLVLIEYGTGDHPDTHDNDSYDLCPGLDQRGPFKPEDV